MESLLKIKSETGRENQSEELIYVTLVHDIDEQSWKKNWKEVKKSRKIGQDQKSLISTFVLFLAAMDRSLISGNEIFPSALSPPNFEIFLIYPTFLRS